MRNSNPKPQNTLLNNLILATRARSFFCNIAAKDSAAGGIAWLLQEVNFGPD
jgi:hypothetical protein